MDVIIIQQKNHQELIMTHRCDNCGEFINDRDFNFGATQELISSSALSGEVWEVICKNCNKENKNVA